MFYGQTVRWEWSGNGRAPWTLVSMVYGLKDCSASDDDDDTTETDNDGTDGDDTPTGNDPDPEEDTPSVTCPTLPDASTICKGRNEEVPCSDGTTRTVEGTKTTSDCPQTWKPHRNTVCYPDAFTQTSSLGDHITKPAFGTKLTGECQLSCPDVPDPSSICVGETEQWTCDGQPSRTIVGTSNAYPCPATCEPDPDPTPSSLCVGDHVRVTCSYGTPRDVYGTSNDCPPCDSSKCAATCDQTYLAPDGSDPETFALGCPSGTTFTVTNDCQWEDERGCTGRPTLRWSLIDTWTAEATAITSSRKPQWAISSSVIDCGFEGSPRCGGLNGGLPECYRTGQRAVQKKTIIRAGGGPGCGSSTAPAGYGCFGGSTEYSLYECGS